MLFTSAATFHDLGTLVLGDHALDLQQQVLLGPVTRGIAQEDNFNAAVSEFLKYQHLISIFA